MDQRPKSSVLRAFGMHRRTNSQGDALDAVATPSRALGEVSLNAAPSPTKSVYPSPTKSVYPSPTKSVYPSPTKSVYPSPTKSDHSTPATASPTKSSPKKKGFLSRPKSFKNLYQLAAGHDRSDTATTTADRNKENCAPAPQQREPTPPIYAQFCRTGTGSSGESASSNDSRRPRPASYHPSSQAMQATQAVQAAHATQAVQPRTDALDDNLDAHLEALLDRRNIPEHQRYKMRNLTATIKKELIRQDWAEARAKQPGGESPEKMLPSTTQTAAPAPPPSSSSPKKHSRGKSMTLSKVVTRGRSTERSRGGAAGSGNGSGSEKRHKSPGSPLKRRFEAGTLGRHLRSKSTESVVLGGRGGGGGDNGDAAVSSAAAAAATTPESTGLSGLFSRATTTAQQQHTPADFVQYLQTVQAPEAVAVGRLQKLRQLLRNETVAWTEAFVGQGGMAEVVGLLYRILAVEWREEHEDALLHETLLCLKALCTTAAALAYVDAIHGSLLPALIQMLFDPEKKGPSEFATRHLVTWVLFAYIERAPSGAARRARAAMVLGYLRDDAATPGAAASSTQVVPWVLEMRKERPYRVWCKEVVSVTKEVFWIFLHQLNVVSLDNTVEDGDGGEEADDDTYMQRHFPRARAPVPAAPYVGGVEWEATNYLASHVDLVNALVACTPTRAGRNRLREQMAMSGWERCLGGSLRLCKEKFYGAVHDGLRTWVAAAHADGWAVRTVRYGEGGVSAHGGSGSTSSGSAETPRLAMPKLDFVLD